MSNTTSNISNNTQNTNPPQNSRPNTNTKPAEPQMRSILENFSLKNVPKN